jgi:flagellar basal-body rod modification protein FlgD
MLVNSVDYFSGSSNSYRQVNRELDKEAFLSLLITQLRYQNPIKPLDNTEFIAQLAQFSSLEQMTNLNKNFLKFLEIQNLSLASSLIGRNIKAVDPDTSEEITGKIQAVKLEEGKLYFVVDGKELNIENVQIVF